MLGIVTNMVVMRIAILLFFFVLLQGCRSDIILCPVTKAPKMRTSTVRHSQIRKHRHEQPAPSASARIYQNRYKDFTFKTSSDTKSAEGLEDWDCPKPGGQKNKKIARENRKRIEKMMRSMAKSKREADTVQTLIPPSSGSRDF